MNLEKLFWSKAKTDILKYLVFRRQGISIRAFESELDWSFPAIKKQIDQLDEAGVIEIKKTNNKRSIYLSKWIDGYIRNFFLYSLTTELQEYFAGNDIRIDKFFLWKLFGIDIEQDLVLIYNPEWLPHLAQVKEDINMIFRRYLIEMVSLVVMSRSDFEKRYRLADKFVLNLMKQTRTTDI